MTVLCNLYRKTPIFFLLIILSCISESGPEDRLTYHRWMGGPAPQEGQDSVVIPSILFTKAGEKIETSEDWYGKRRPELIKLWTEVLGKLEPSPEDEKWFGDITNIKTYSHDDMGDYIRMHIGIPIEIDFYQDHLLLLPKNPSRESMPAIIAWVSTTPDFTEPERWWGSYLARNGYVVLTSWSFIRNYRDSTNFRSGANEKVYERFGHWLPMAKMVHDVQREAEYLCSLPQVDPDRIGFIGLSLSAKTAVYVAAFSPEIKATVSIDPHIALNGSTNWYDPWYLDWSHTFPGINTEGYPYPELRGTVQSLLDPDPETPGFERNHHELMALCAPRAFMIIGGNCDKEFFKGHSDDLQSWGYVNRAMEVYELLGIPERFEFVPTADGHAANGPEIDPAWKRFFNKWLKTEPVQFDGY
ncbi:alpha/beta hydrolase family protein [Bacteroidota bacterium]